MLSAHIRQHPETPILADGVASSGAMVGSSEALALGCQGEDGGRCQELAAEDGVHEEECDQREKLPVRGGRASGCVEGRERGGASARGGGCGA